MYEEAEGVVLYGSRAKDNYKPGSDFDDLLLPYTFDLSIYHHVTNHDLLEHIERVGKIFYKRGGGKKGD